MAGVKRCPEWLNHPVLVAEGGLFLCTKVAGHEDRHEYSLYTEEGELARGEPWKPPVTALRDQPNERSEEKA